MSNITLLLIMSFHPFPLSTFPLLPTLFSISFLSTSSSSSFYFSSLPWFCRQQLWGAVVRQEPAWAVENGPGGCREHLCEASLTMKATPRGGTYGLNTEPWIQPASEWVAVGKANILVLRDLSRGGCGTLLSETVLHSVFFCWLRHRVSGQPDCHRPFTFLSWFWQTAYSLDREVADFIHSETVSKAGYPSLLHSPPAQPLPAIPLYLEWALP